MEEINNDIDNNVDDAIFLCLNPEKPRSFFLFAGAGSGKTRSLVNVLTKFKTEYGKQFRLKRQKVAIITYTNAASNEIKHRLEYDSIFQVSTIHSFAWETIKSFTKDIREWVRVDLQTDITTLSDEQGRSRNLQNKTSIDRARKIESKTKRLQNLDSIIKFTYNPNGDNASKNSLNHTQVISIAAHFISTKKTMQNILSTAFPIILIDESQDTKKELIDAFFELQKNKKDSFTLGLFGDTMQRIYSDGKENLGQNLPLDWLQPSKRMNHRSNKRIISLINNIRSTTDNQKQVPRTEKEEGYIKLFISKRGKDKNFIENLVIQKMAELTNDTLWNSQESNIKTLILEHHMAALRMGFLDFFAPLYREEKLSTGLLDGTLSGVTFFTKIILPIINTTDKFEIARIVKKYSNYLKKDEIIKNHQQIDNIKKSKTSLEEILQLWNEKSDPLLIEIFKKINQTKLFPLPDNLMPLISRTNEENAIVKLKNSEEEEDNIDDLLKAWEAALYSPFSQVQKYNEYLSEDSKFGTHQGVKGLEYDRVMVIIDDEEARGFLFSYDKLFGSKELSNNDSKNISEGKETGIDRTRRLFYVACSRAKKSLAIVAYTDNPDIVKKNALKYGWFKDEEIEII